MLFVDIYLHTLAYFSKLVGTVDEPVVSIRCIWFKEELIFLIATVIEIKICSHWDAVRGKLLKENLRINELKQSKFREFWDTQNSSIILNQFFTEEIIAQYMWHQDSLSISHPPDNILKL
eukprot:snap_masked-scaffold_49-processed-gene-1.26-mRNA-1 protein AED:1.00 eAED:1.00 QI:0/0/0/0/1/1/4/0/119